MQNKKDFKGWLLAYQSTFEKAYSLFLSNDLHYLNPTDYNHLYRRINEGKAIWYH